MWNSWNNSIIFMMRRMWFGDHTDWPIIIFEWLSVSILLSSAVTVYFTNHFFCVGSMVDHGTRNNKLNDFFQHVKYLTSNKLPKFRLWYHVGLSVWHMPQTPMVRHVFSSFNQASSLRNLQCQVKEVIPLAHILNDILHGLYVFEANRREEKDFVGEKNP